MFQIISRRWNKGLGLALCAMLCLSSCYPDKGTPLETSKRPLFRMISPDSSEVSFANTIKETEESNLFSYMYFYNGGGVAAGDLNGDGLDDLYFTGNQVQNKLYINQGNFTFNDVTDQLGVGGNNDVWYTGVTFADVNNDGRLDVYVSQIGDENGQNLLFINEGNDTAGLPKFKESALELGLVVEGATTQAAFFDYDLDGDLDAYIMTHSNFNDGNLPRAEKRSQTSPYGDKLFRNDGDTFTDVTDASGIYSSTLGFGLGLNTADINKDGYPDLYIGNDFYEDDYLYLNNGDGTFTESLSKYIKHTSRFSMGNDVADMNNDGLPDILSLDMKAYRPEILKTAHGEDSYPIFNYKLSFGYSHQYSHNTFQLNSDGEPFSEIARLAGIDATDWSWSVLGNDFDLDGRKDLFITNGIFKRSNDMDYMQFLSAEEIQKQLRHGNSDYAMALTEKMPSYPLRNFFFRNCGGLKFSDMSKPWGGDSKGFSNGATYADLDNDGDMDLVVNNLNGPASILRNTTIDSKEFEGSYLQMRFKGEEDNPFGLGVKVTLRSEGKEQYQELLGSRGYLSSVPPYLNFGTTSKKNIDTLLVVWPNQTKQLLIDVQVDQKLTVAQSDAVITTKDIDDAVTPIFKIIDSDLLGVDFEHKENRFYEFNREHLIPHVNSSLGPPLAIGDVNSDGLEDFFVGGALNQPSEIYIQTSEGKFIKSIQTALFDDASSEDTAAQFFDADSDGDLDLIVGSGSNQELKPKPESRTRLYVNNGKGNFTKHTEFPEIYATVSCLSISDFDKDEDNDLFIGAKAVPGKYGLLPQSYLLENDGNGNFRISDISDKVFKSSGMVSAAHWADLDGDSWEDLVLVGEWMPIKIYYNKNGQLTDADPKINGLEFSNGWWNTVEITDLDNDGDIDLIAGNLGRNSKLRSTVKEPVKMYFADFDKNGWPEGIITHYIDNKEHVSSSKSVLEKQLQYLKKEFPTYRSFAQADLASIFNGADIENSSVLTAYNFNTSVIENVGNHQFKVKELPIEAQFSTVNAIYKIDYDDNGTMDIVLGENRYGVNTELSRYDAGFGTLLKNLGSQKFEVVPPATSGLLLDGQVRHIKAIYNSRYGKMLIVSKNNDKLNFFQKNG